MKNKIAYFPTPNKIVEIMLKLSTNLNNHNINILDTGFGEMAFLNELIKNFPNNNLTGIELDKKFFDDAKKIHKNTLNLINEDYLTYQFKNNFDLIIENPPYINSDNLPLYIKNKIKDLTKSGEGNIYYRFILKSIKNLNINGELIYIVPYDFFFNTYGNYLRNYKLL